MSSPDAPGDRQPARHFTVHVEAVPSDVTGLPLMWNSGGKTALDRVAPAVYDELRRLASRLMILEPAGHTLLATASDRSSI